ncbi:glycosyltransferase family 2 protein [Polaromonas sp. YR568]|uniref:glycosyltransferase family 2 protein n=1 Tax=Polaromonas sp. YR568 TaxID=1855301 RepID=UPI0031381AAF
MSLASQTPLRSASRASTPGAANVCAVVVTYFPDDKLEARLRAVLPQVARLVVVDNTPGEATQLGQRMAALGDSVHCIINGTNQGVATALNQGLGHALGQGLPWLLTLDQDSCAQPDMVAVLARALESSQPRPAVIGSNYMDPVNQRLKISVGNEVVGVEQKTVITSGSLVDAAVARDIGGFRDDYFIDQLDHEFCLRMRAHGYRVVISGPPAMVHSVGLTGGARLPVLGTLPNHGPVRKYYIARNTVTTVALYWRHEPVWCVRRLVRLFLGLAEMALLEDRRLLKVQAFFWGLWDGWRGRMGPCQRDLVG